MILRPTRAILAGLALLTLGACSGGGGGSSTPPPPSSTITGVSIAPATAPLTTGGQQQFTPTVTGTGSFSSAVTWSASSGTVTGAGLYTAPATTGSYTVTATSVQDPTKSGSAAVTVTAASTITSVAIAPTAPSLVSGQVQLFTATVAGIGSFSSAVTWSGNGTAFLSSLTANPATFTASTAGTFSLIATSTQDPSKTATTTVTVTLPIATSLSYTNPASGTYKLVRDASSTATHLVLNLVGPGAIQMSGVGFYLTADLAKVTWVNVGADKVASAAFSNTILKTKLSGDTLQAGVYQKGLTAAVTPAAAAVLAQVALDLKAGIAVGSTITLTAPAGKAAIMNPPANPTVNTTIAISLGTLIAN